jgi:UDP-glucose 4-epimerase
MRDPDVVLKFLKGESIEEVAPSRGKRPDGAFKFNYTKGKRDADGIGSIFYFVPPWFAGKIRKRFATVRFDKEKKYHPAMLTRLPMFRKIRDNVESTSNEEEDYGLYLPVNQSIGTFENHVLPVKIFKHFFDKASHIAMVNTCGCRVNYDCKNHPHDIGCMYLGDGVLEIRHLEQRARILTKEEALEILLTSIDDGLIPILGRSHGEANGNSVKDEAHFLSMCFCCECCCVNAKTLTQGSLSLKRYQTMDGLTVKVNEDICTGCGDCIEACKFKGMKMIDGIAQVNQERCLRCGRCETACQHDAISIILDDNSRIDDLIAKLESHVDVRDQATLQE